MSLSARRHIQWVQEARVALQFKKDDDVVAVELGAAVFGGVARQASAFSDPCGFVEPCGFPSTRFLERHCFSTWVFAARLLLRPAFVGQR
jgi:hypothetical protein